MATETRIIKLEINSAPAARSLRRMDRNLEKTRKSAQGLQASFTKLNRVFGVLALAGVGGGAIRGLVQMVDGYRELEGRVNLVAKETVGLEAAMDDITATALLTYTSMESVGIAYTRLGNATRELGVGHEDLIKLSTALADSIRLSGATAKEADAFMIQFAQGLASGALQGDEFRTVSESNIRIMQVLQKEFGKSAGELKKMAAEGLLVAERVIPAILAEQEKLREEAESLPITVGRSWTNLETIWVRFLGQMERGVGVFGALAQGISTFAKGVDLLGQGLDYATKQVEEYDLELAIKGVTSATYAFEEANKKLEIAEAKVLAVEERRSEFWTTKSFDAAVARVDKERTAAALERKDALVLLYDWEKKVSDIVKSNLSASPTAAGGSSILTGGATGGATNKASTGDKLDKLTFTEAARAVGLFNDELDQYQTTLDGISQTEELTAEKTKVLIQNFESGSLSVDQFREAFEGLYSEIDLAATETEKAIGWTEALSTALGQTLASATSTASDAIIDFAVRAEGSFSDAAQSILESIGKMMIQMALMRSLFGATGSDGLIGGYFPSANGNVFQGGNVVPFASGGVVTQPTLFPMATGTGLMGEAGPEAIMPLSRGKDGKLGVSGGGTVVNIQNNSGQEATATTETGPNGEEFINVVIGAVANDMATGGATAKAVEQSYGVRRSGNMR